MGIINENIDNGREFDWGRASGDYARYRDIYPEKFYQTIVDLGLCTAGQKVLDLGTGTGVLPRNLYRCGASFTGADISGNQIAEAQRLTQELGMDIDYIVSPAEDLDFPDGSFDVVTASQCHVYFDMENLLPKLHRILKEDGHFCILFTAWVTEESKIAKKTEKLILKYNPFWTGGNSRRCHIKMPAITYEYFSAAHNFIYDVDIPFTRESWNGRIRACRGVGASSLPDREIEAFEKEHMKFLNSMNKEFVIPHFVALLDLKKKKR